MVTLKKKVAREISSLSLNQINYLPKPPTGLLRKGYLLLVLSFHFLLHSC